jgi:hypothetical protein
MTAAAVVAVAVAVAVAMAVAVAVAVARLLARSPRCYDPFPPYLHNTTFPFPRACCVCCHSLRYRSVIFTAKKSTKKTTQTTTNSCHFRVIFCTCPASCTW